MIDLSKYKETTYQKLQIELRLAFAKSKMTVINLADRMDVKSVTSIRNCFSPTEQVASDKLFSGVMKYLKVPGVILYNDGARYYYIKNKP